MVAAASDSPTVTFVVPVRNDAGRLERCLDSIVRAHYRGPRQVIVADNGSVDRSPDVARAAGAHVLSLPGLSVAQLRNQAAAHVREGILAFVDADHTIEPGWVQAAVDSLAQPCTGAVGMAYLGPPDPTWVQQACDAFRSRPSGVVEVDWLGSGNLAMWAAAFHAVGGFDTSLETCEDVDLCNRLRLGGYRLLSDDRMRSTHYGDPTTLRALFFGELWRGRDNIRVTLRGPLTPRALPSLLIPVGNLVCLGLLGGGLVALPYAGVLAPMVGTGGLASTVLLRTARMWRTNRASGLLGCAAVAAVYEVARALALILRATHRTRRERAGEGRP